MRFAVISDVQGNAVALRAVLEDLGRRHDDVERVVSVGDNVGRGPEPNQVLELLREAQIESVRGNYDDAVAFDRLGSGADFPDLVAETADARAIAWTRSTLTPENLEYLRALPREIRLRPEFRGIQVEHVREDERTREYRRTFVMRSLFGGLVRENRRALTKTLRVLLVHGSPRALNELVREQTANSLLEAMTKDANTDVMVSGHAGESFLRHWSDTAFVGVGSVSGVPGIGPVARYAVVDVTDAVNASFHEVEYDATALVDALRVSGLPDAVTAPFQG